MATKPSPGNRTTSEAEVFHVPGSTSPADEFFAPIGQWYSIYRAVTYDGWLLWKDALPEETMLRKRLDLASFENITFLAKRIHALHQNVDNYRRLDQSPFRVSRWWDPLDERENPDQHWHLGRHMLFRVAEFTAKQFMAIPQRKTQVQLRAVSVNWMEATLPLEVSKGLQGAASPLAAKP